MYSVYFLNYNNYYNRILKVLPYTEATSYLAFPDSTNYPNPLKNVNFDYNDGLNTKIIINVNESNVSNINYVLARNGNLYEIKHVTTRWFVIGYKKIRTQQFELYLKRDLLADYKSDIMTAPCFVEKGYCDINDPAFFNSELINVNQIITKETPIKDEMGMPWVVAFITKGTGWENNNPVKYNNGMRQNAYATFTSTDAALAQLGHQKLYNMNQGATMELMISDNGNKIHRYEISTGQSGTSLIVNGYSSIYGATTLSTSLSITDSTRTESTENIYTGYMCNATGINEGSPKTSYNGKIIMCGEKYYKVKMTLTSYNNMTANATYEQIADLYNRMQGNILSRIPATYAELPSTKYNALVGFKISAVLVIIELIEQSQYTEYSTIISSSRAHGQTYDLLATPLPKGTYKFRNKNGTQVSVDESKLKSVLSFYGSLSESLGTSRVFDVQVIPYNPIPSFYNNGYIDLYALREGLDYTIDGSDSFPILYLMENEFEYDIENIDEETLNPTYNKKYFIGKKWRLIAPNFNTNYDLPVYENKGIDSFHIDMTLLPYQSYLRIRPVFKYMNGINEDDARGLVINGSLSLSQTSSAWAEYQYSNMNYEAIQNASVQYQKNQYDIQNQKNLISGVTGSISSGISGAVGGALVGGPVGAVVGGVVGLGASAAGLGLDQYYDRKSQNLTLNYSQDMYQLQLGNIKGQSPTLAKITALNNCYKWWPYIEQVECTEVEYTAIENKLKYNGMSINRIGTLQDFTKYGEEWYIKGKIIRLNLENYDIVNAISEEVNLGFFVEGE